MSKNNKKEDFFLYHIFQYGLYSAIKLINSNLISKGEDFNLDLSQIGPKLKKVYKQVSEQQTRREAAFLTLISHWEAYQKELAFFSIQSDLRLLGEFGAKEFKVDDLIRNKKKTIVENLIEKIISKYNFQNAESLEEFWKRLGIEIFEDDEEKEFYEKFLELRHMYTHQAGYRREPARANEKIQEKQGYILKRRSLDIGELSLFMDILCKISKRLDRKVSEKFDILSPDEYLIADFEPDSEVSPEDIEI